MKTAVALLTLMMVLAIQDTSAWRVRQVWDRTAGRVIRDAGHVLRKKSTLAKIVPSLLNDDMSDEYLLRALSTRDLGDLVDVNDLSDPELTELYATQRDTREHEDELDA